MLQTKSCFLEWWIPSQSWFISYDLFDIKLYQVQCASGCRGEVGGWRMCSLVMVFTVSHSLGDIERFCLVSWLNRRTLLWNCERDQAFSVEICSSARRVLLRGERLASLSSTCVTPTSQSTFSCREQLTVHSSCDCTLLHTTVKGRAKRKGNYIMLFDHRVYKDVISYVRRRQPDM